MKKFVKPIILLVLAAVFVSLLIIPSHLPAAGPVTLSGQLEVHDKVITCICPLNNNSCQCVILKPPVQ